MKLHLTAIAFNEKELESYVAQLKSQSFETVSDVKKAEDGAYYQAMAKTVRLEPMPPAQYAQIDATLITENRSQ